jgi:hypothetical protein
VGIDDGTEDVATSTGVVLWRGPVVLGALVCLIPLGCVFAVAVQGVWSWYAWLMVLGLSAVIDFHARGLWRRRCALDDRQLRAKGRYASRTVELSDLRQVGSTRGGTVWVHTHHSLDQRGGTYLSLPMIPGKRLELSTGPTSGAAVDIIRARAETVGAKLDPPLTRSVRPEQLSGKPLLFGM